ncbi:MAG TPA: TIGR03118 family protein [Pirellulales bacterium]|jgi:uncharacterized protein (TIGR03118 family)|nr:TIGR03118 family protein [Pirellulales bacterium]
MKRVFRRRPEPLEARTLLDAAGSYFAIALASSAAGSALVSDPALVNPWGVALGPNAELSVSDNLAGQTSSFAGAVAGSPFGISHGSVHAPLPTAQVYNGTNDFIINPGGGTLAPAASEPVAPAEFLYASLNGQIYASNGLTGSQAVAVVTRPPSATAIFAGPAFTGLAIDDNGSGDYLYAADFLGGKIDVFDGQFKPASLAGSFSDPNLPAGYFPFNIQNIGGELYVTYARQLRPPGILGPAGSEAGSSANGAIAGTLEVSGNDAAILNAVRPLLPAGGVIDVYDANGALLRRFASDAPLDGPWGMALAPAGFGPFGGDLLVGNYADGQINAFDPATDKWLGALTDAAGQPIAAPGLWGLAFGNGTQAGDANTLFYAAGLNFFGRPIPPSPPVSGPTAASSGDAGASAIAYPLPIFPGQLGAIEAANAGPISALAATLSAEEGFAFAGPVAAFGSSQPPSPLANPLPDFTATIDWSDGTTSQGEIRATGNGGYLVVGKHVYAEEGTETYSVVIADRAGDKASAAGTVKIHDTPLLAVGLPASVSTGGVVTGAHLAVFGDLGGAESIGNYAATIDWGDGTSPSTETISLASATDDVKAAPLLSAAGVTTTMGPKFVVTGSHTYAADGNYWATITITDEGGSEVKVRSLVLVGAPNSAFIEQAFRDILHRDVDAVGLEFWKGRLAGGLTSADLAAALTHSAEYFANLIQPAYARFLGRAADAQGLNYWIGQMQQGLTDQQLAAAFAASPEFYAGAGGSAGGWVDALYPSLLNRAVDSQGRSYWVSQLAAGASRQSIALGFATSSEQAESQLRDDYFNLLGRAPSSDELHFWVGTVESGATDEQVLAAFVASPEYAKKLGN